VNLTGTDDVTVTAPTTLSSATRVNGTFTVGAVVAQVEQHPATPYFDLLTPNYLKFMTGYYQCGDSFPSAGSDDLAGYLGQNFQLQPNHIQENHWNMSGNKEVFLPAALVDRLVIFRYTRMVTAATTGQVTFTTASGDTFADFVLNPPITAYAGNGRVLPDSAERIASDVRGSYILATGGTNKTHFHAPNGQNHAHNAGAEYIFYCEVEGEWLLALVPFALGTGVQSTPRSFT
jgi:hypothetical protein